MISFFLTGCLGTRHLGENERLLYSQSIQAPSGINKEALKNLYAQRPNRRIGGAAIAPLVAIYYAGAKRYDQEKYVRKKEAAEAKFNHKIENSSSDKKINNYQFRKQKKVDKYTNRIENGNLFMQWGEPVAAFDSASVKLTEERFHAYLYAQGYFTNQVKADVRLVRRSVDLRKQQIHVTYVVTPGQPYILDSLFYDVEDTTILRLLHQHENASLLRQGDRFNEDAFTKERERIDLLMRDYGYYDFSRQYVEFKTDSSYRHPHRRVAVMTIVNDPAKRGYHKQFTIDSVTFTTDTGTPGLNIQRQHRANRDIHYFFYADNYNLNILSQRVFLKPGDLYSRTRTLNTQRQLSNVDAFKFTNINYDTVGGRFVANIYSSPLPRYEWSNEAGVNVTQGYPGPFYNIAFRKRNIFRGLEVFDLSGRFGFEGVASVTSKENFYRSTEAGVNASLTFPQFIWPFREHVRFRLAQYNPKTKFSVGYGYTDRPEYRRTTTSIVGSYTWQNNRNRTYQLTPLNIGIINVDTADLSRDFLKLLVTQAQAGNYSLLNAFRPSFVSSIIFGVTWNQNKYGNTERNSSFIRAQIESGGTWWNLLNNSYVSRLVDSLEIFKYIRVSLDMRRINVLNKTTTLAYRFNAGFAYSYSANKSLPYEKFFFAGGSNSIRAWRPRRLGPGSVKPETSSNPREDGLYDYSIEKPATILMEASVELRQKLFGFVSGALFVDAGNTWTFNQQGGDRGNSQFRFNQFYKEIAVGTGFGLRFDFTFLILRLDVGMKVYDPARDEQDRFVLNRVRFWKPYATQGGDGSYANFREPVIYNVGIGYSF